VEGLKCPICKAISLVNIIKDGEMFTCPFCSYRFTVTDVRRYFLQPQYNIIEINENNFDKYLENLEHFQLLEIMQKVLKELGQRFPDKSEYSLVNKGC